MKHLIAAGIVGGVAGVVGFALGIIMQNCNVSFLKEELEAEKKETDLRKKQIFNFQYDLNEIGINLEDGQEILYEHIKKISDDAFDGLEYEHSAAGLKEV